MNEKNFPQIFIIVLVLAVVVTTVFSFQNVWAKQATLESAVGATVKISVCGNGVAENPEQCDQNDLNNQTCTGLGFYGGTLSCQAACIFNVSGCSTIPPSAPRRPRILPPVGTKVVIEGKAYPQAEVTLLSDGQVIATKKADSLANFRFEITDITPGIYTFSLWAMDSDGRKSTTFSLTANIIKDVTTTVSEILLPPTVELGKKVLKRGEFLDISGQTAPESEVSIYIGLTGQEIIGKTKATTDGKWFYSFDTSDLDKGTYFIKVKAISPEGLVSSFSQALVFYFEKIPVEEEEVCPRGDLNQDGRVNLIDFSILLHWWGKANVCADQNGDGIVNLPDFSIMMYYWTG